MTRLTALHQQREVLQREWARLVPEMRELRRPFGPMELRPEIAGSWVRALRTVDPHRRAAPMCGEGSIERRWESSPLRPAVEELLDLLAGVADAGFATAVAEESGTILWSASGRTMRRRAEEVNFRAGGRWDEQAMGANAIALTVQSGRPELVFAAEHLVLALHPWVGYCAPVRARNGRILGGVAIATTWDRATDLGLSTARALATAIEARLHSGTAGPLPARRAPQEDEGHQFAGLELHCLGKSRALYRGEPLALTPRQMEILTLLALEPSGYSPAGLAIDLYGDRPVTISTMKAEMSHLRRLLHGDVTARHYALTTPVACDARAVLAALEQGDLSAALRLYQGSLLAQSEAPGVTAWRDRIDVALRSAVLASPRPEHALAYGARHPDDLEVHEHALNHLSRGDRRRPIATARRHSALHPVE